MCSIPFLNAQNALSYKWKANSVYKFKSTQTDNIKMGGSGFMGMAAMAGDMKFTTESAFNLKINQVLPNGSARGSFLLTSFKVSDNQGNILANLSGLPSGSVKADFLVDKKGNFTFVKLPVLLRREGASMLVSTSLKNGQISATSEFEGEKVSLFAEFNPKTGALKGGYSVQTISKPKPKQVTVKEEDEILDIIPTDFLDLLEIPSGPISAGQTFKTKMYGTEIIEKVVSFSNNIARINFDVKSGIDSKKFENDAKKMAGEEDGDEMESGMGDIGMPGFGGESETPQIAQEMTGNFTLDFDNGIGMIKSLAGTINTKSNMMGMEVEQKSNLKMNHIP
jgi:hypothetical protein